MNAAFTQTVFIADDEPFCNSLYEQHLLQNGFSNIITFSTGGELIKHIHLKPALILLDYHLGDISGKELLQIIRTNLPGTCVVVISGQQDMEVAVEMLNRGAFDYIVKNGQELSRLTTITGKWLAVLEYREKFKATFGDQYSEKCLGFVAEAQEKVRQEIAGELHDNVNQLLGTSMLFLRTAGTSKHVAKEMIDESVKVIDMAINEIRKMSHSLRFVYVKENEVWSEFSKMLEALRLQQQFNLHTNIILPDGGAAIPEFLKHQIVRITQEQIQNIIKYANASRVDISVKYVKDHLVLTTADNGSGFSWKEKKNGMGLQQIRNRVDAMNGSCQLITAPGKGCTWNIRFPLVQKQPNTFATAV
ncbi:MAG: response regulator [Bacteroidetes bacterium]|nr:response regulator [Bacteroidota bacterium]